MIGKILWLLATLLLADDQLAEAQQPPQVPRIGFVQRRLPPTPTTPDPLADAFRQGLRELGYIDGKNIKIEELLMETAPEISRVGSCYRCYR